MFFFSNMFLQDTRTFSRSSRAMSFLYLDQLSTALLLPITYPPPSVKDFAGFFDTPNIHILIENCNQKQVRYNSSNTLQDGIYLNAFTTKNLNPI
jgi:hypothetical protein